MIKIVIEGRPVPKSRPRMVRGRVYTPRKTQQAEEKIAWYAIAQGIKPLEGYLKVECRFYFKGKQHSDCDNLLKLVADSGNKGILWKDDRQILDFRGIILLNQPIEKTEISIVKYRE